MADAGLSWVPHATCDDTGELLNISKLMCRQKHTEA